MPEPIETDIQSDPALSGAVRLARVGTDFGTAWAAINARITTLNGGRPWGGDEVGVTFAEQYMPDGEPTAGAAGLLQGVTSLATVLHGLGTSVYHAVTGSLSDDEEIGRGLQPQ